LYLYLAITEIAMSPPFTTFGDSALIKLTLAGEAECFAVLMDRHLAATRKRIRSMVPDASGLDDLLQEVALKIWCHLGTFRSESSFRTWMTRVAINEPLQSYRRERSRPRPEPLGDFHAFASPGQSPYSLLLSWN
jgi:RNA polymerase sigma-70 factor (ECF subfamily)